MHGKLIVEDASLIPLFSVLVVGGLEVIILNFMYFSVLLCF